MGKYINKTLILYFFPSPQYAHNIIYNDNRTQQNIAIKSSIAKFMGEVQLDRLKPCLKRMNKGVGMHFTTSHKASLLQNHHEFRSSYIYH
jgi:hypothetical protein